MDEAPFPDNGDEEDAPPPPPTAFGLAAEPFGCSLVAGLGFAAFMAPFLVDPPNRWSCVDLGGECVPVGDDLSAGLALAALLGLAFGAATAGLVRGRVRAWREGRRVPPPLWVAFVALFAVGCMAAGWAMAPVQWLLAAVGAVTK